MIENMETFRLLYLALGPGIALAVYIYYSDKWEPEPKALVIKGFLLGGLACFPTSYFEGVFENFFGLYHVVYAGQWVFHDLLRREMFRGMFAGGTVQAAGIPLHAECVGPGGRRSAAGCNGARIDVANVNVKSL